MSGASASSLYSPAQSIPLHAGPGPWTSARRRVPVHLVPGRVPSSCWDERPGIHPCRSPSSPDRATAWPRGQCPQPAVDRQRLRLDHGAGQEHLPGGLRERQVGGQPGPGQPMIPVPAWASRGSIAPGQRFCARTVSDHGEQDGDGGDDRHREAGHGRAEFPELRSPSSTVSHPTGRRIVSFPEARASTPLSLGMTSPVVTACTSSSTRPGRQKSLHATAPLSAPRRQPSHSA